MNNQVPTNKVDFYERWERGEFGNKIISFPTYKDFVSSQYDGLVAIRYKEAGSPYHAHGVRAYDVAETVYQFSLMGADKKKFTYNEIAPDEYLTLQGEISRSVFGWSLDYSTLKKAMRPALREGRQRTKGSGVLAILRSYCNSNSYEMIMDLFEKYDSDPLDTTGIVVEFSCYEKCVGDLPGHNTLIWEVRQY